MNNPSHLWQQREAATQFLEDVRGAIPLAAEQFDVLLRVIRHTIASPSCLLDLGCGDGILGRIVMTEYPECRGVFVDYSEPMLEAAGKKVDRRRSTLFAKDLASTEWIRDVADRGPFDLIVSGLAIHHLTDGRKQALYREIFDLLRPGGLFLNLEHVTLASDWAKAAYDEMFIDSVTAFHHQHGGKKTREEIVAQWRERTSRSGDIESSAELQCQWLRETGFESVDCFFKLFRLALFGGRKSESLDENAVPE
jgi:SAM-dependent methyltransferase